MFEGQRLSYVVPGYTGYISYYVDIFLKKYTRMECLSRKNKELRIFPGMLDMYIQLNRKTYTVQLLVKQLMTLIMDNFLRGRILLQNKNMYLLKQEQIFLLQKCSEELLLILLVFQINK